MIKKQLGVVIGRFQVSELHSGHLKLIKKVFNDSDRVVIFIGVRDGEYSNKDPMSFEVRKCMLEEEFKDKEGLMDILKLEDRREDDTWSKEIDAILLKKYDKYEITLYGSRDSFIPYYSGKFKTKEIRQEPGVLSGTEMRKEISENPIKSIDFRKGIIYANQIRYPVVYQVTDVAVLSKDGTKVLLGRKDKCLKFQFFGGYVDPTDTSLDFAAKREVEEEAGGIVTGAYKYICSTIVDDFRYWGQRDKIMTIFFSTEYISGEPIARDDIVEVKWFNISELLDVLPEYHYNLGKELIKKIK